MKLLCKSIQKLSLLAFIALLAGCGTKAPTPPKTIQKGDYSYLKTYMNWYIQEQMDQHDIVGLSVALVDNQQIVWQKGFGYANKEQKIKATPETRYRAGSITKLFNGMATMKLAEEGKMDIDQPLMSYLPEFSIKSRFGSTDAITPRNIMSHHSGLPGDWIDKMFANNPTHYTEYVNLIKEAYVAYPPKYISAYSNLGTTLLGHAVEKVSGESYSDYLQKTLLKPLNMQHSDLEMRLSGSNASLSYTHGKATEEYALGAIPAGALNTTVTDLAQLAIMVNGNGTYNHKTILQPHTLTSMFQVQNSNVALDLSQKIGLAWFINETLLPNQEPLYHHDGGTVAHRSSFLVAPNSKLGVVVLSNSDRTNSTNIAHTLLKKAWEAKTGTKLPKPTDTLPTPTTPIQEGVYSSMLGKLNISKHSNEAYLAKSSHGTFKLSQQNPNRYSIKYKLFGLFPITVDEFKEVQLYSKVVEGEELLVANAEGEQFIAGVKVIPSPIPESWHNYLGEYHIVNQLEPKAMQIKKITAKIEDQFPVIEIETMSGEKMVDILKIINDNEAIIEGLGRSKRETIRYKDGIFHYAGLRFKRVK